MSDVMEVTKMAKGGLYGHFESKDELCHAVVDYNLGKIAETVANAVNKASSAKDKLFAFLEVFNSPTQYPVEGGCPILNFGTEADDTSPVVREKVKSIILQAQTTAANIIRKGIVDGEFKATFKAKEFAIMMFSILEGGVLIGRVLGTNSQMKMMINMLKKEIEHQLE